MYLHGSVLWAWWDQLHLHGSVLWHCGPRSSASSAAPSEEFSDGPPSSACSSPPGLPWDQSVPHGDSEGRRGKNY